MLDQCCDAIDYIDLGKACAIGGDCYDELRPMGSIYWFSIPFRLGWDASSIINIHIALAVLSVLLSFYSVMLLSQDTRLKTRSSKSYIFICSLIIHAVFLYPVIRHSLSDAPASLFFLIGLWSIVIYYHSKMPAKILWALLSGLCLGFSAWMRVFFLYPVTIFMIGMFIYACMDPARRKSVFFVLTGCIPLLTQVYFVHQKTGALAYIEPETAAWIERIHGDSDAVGWDTMLPPVAIRQPTGKKWRSSCEQYKTPLQALKSGDFYSLYCIVSGRIYFYLGSYSEKTYHAYDVPAIGDFNLLYEDDKKTYKKDNVIISRQPQAEPNIYQIAAGQWKNISLLKTSGEYGGDVISAFKISKIDPDASSELNQSLHLDAGYNYVFAVWVWSNHGNDHNLEFFIRKHGASSNLATNIYAVGDKPHLIDVMAMIKEDGMYDIGIKSMTYPPGTAIGDAALAQGVSVNQDSFYVWKPRLLKAQGDPWVSQLALISDKTIRHWSLVWLLINVFVWLIALRFIARLMKHDGMIGWSLFGLVGLATGMALMIVPEQRFFIAPMIFAWLMFVTGAKDWFVNFLLRP